MEDIKRDTFDKVYLFSIIGIILFFVPIKINNEFETIIYHLSYFLESKILSFIDISIIFFVGLSTLRDLINYKTSNISKFKIVMKIFSEIILISIFINKEKILFLDGEFVLILKDLLLEKASEGFDWGDISPTIFGAVFESTLNPETRMMKRIEIEDGKMASDITALLMGNEVPPRKAYIYEHANDAQLDI